MSRRVAILAASLVAVAACGNGPPTGTSTELSPSLTLATVSGDSQIGETGRLLQRFLVFRVTDGAGAPVTGLRVKWEVVSGGGKVSGKRHETDAAGLAAGNFTLGPALGEQVARAVVRDSIAIAFTAFALPQPPRPATPQRVPPCCRYTIGLPIARIPTTISASAPATPRSGRP